MQRQVRLCRKVHHLPRRKLVVQNSELVLLQIAHKSAVVIHDGENHVDFVCPHTDGGEFLITRFFVCIIWLLFAASRWQRSGRRRRGGRRSGLLRRGQSRGNTHHNKKERVLFENHK